MTDSAEGNVPPPPAATATKPGVWQRARGVLVRTEGEFAFVKGLTFLGFLGSLIAAYFQYISAYHDKVNTLAKEDLAAATSAFTDASNALSVPLSLQERLIFAYAEAIEHNKDSDDNALVTKSARQLMTRYDTVYAGLREGISLTAQKMEIYLDWPSNLEHDPAKAVSPTADPINSSMLGSYNFDCDNYMPSFEPGETKLHLKNEAGEPLDIDWHSAKHNVLTIYYCFRTLHDLMEPARQWASKTTVDADKKQRFVANKAIIAARLNKQVIRLNAFMNVAMNEIEQIRVKYRPNGYFCNVPVVREIIGFVSRRCTPIRVAED